MDCFGFRWRWMDGEKCNDDVWFPDSGESQNDRAGIIMIEEDQVAVGKR